MPRKRTGSIERPSKDKLRARVTVTTFDGQAKRIWFSLDPKLSDAKARRVAERLSERLAKQPLDEHQIASLIGSKGSTTTVAQFFFGVYEPALDLPRYQVSHWVNHILPAVGNEEVRTFSPDALRRLVEQLDARVRLGRLSANTAGVIWRLARKFAKDLSMHKQARIRIRTDNPSATVRGPDGGKQRAKQWLYPVELRMLWGGDSAAPLARFVAVSVYLCSRPGETFGLEWRHIDLDRNMVRIDQTRDPRTKEVGPTKGREVRVFPIPAVLLPVLRQMSREQDGDGFLFGKVPRGPEILTALRAAGVTRHELHESTSTSRAFRCHDCRATGISYLALGGASDDEVRERAGHSDFSTTLLYVRRGKLAADVGDPFAPLGERQIESSRQSSPGVFGGSKPGVVGGRNSENSPKRVTQRILGVNAGTHSSQPALGSVDDSIDDSDPEVAEFLTALAEHSERAAVARLLFGGRPGGAP